MNTELFKRTLIEGGSSANWPGREPGMIVAAAAVALEAGEAATVDRAAVVDALNALNAAGACTFLAPLVVVGGHPAWTSFFVELAGRGSVAACVELRRRASHTGDGNANEGTEIVSAMIGTPFEGFVGRLTRGNCPYVPFSATLSADPTSEENGVLYRLVSAVQDALIDDKFAQPVAHVTKSSKANVTTVTASPVKTSKNVGRVKTGVRVAKKYAVVTKGRK